MTREEKRILLIKKRLTVTELARRIGKGRSWTHKVYFGHEKGDPTLRDIARVLGVRAEELRPNGNGTA